MRGHITKRGMGTWAVVVSLGRDASTGKYRQQWVSVKGTKKDAEKKLAELLHQMDLGIPIETRRCTVREYLERWLTDVVAVRNRPRTVEAYDTITRRHLLPTLGTLQLTKLQASDVERMEAALLASGLSRNTVRHVHVVLAKALKDAMRKGLLHLNVCHAVEPPSIGRYEVRVPDAEAIARILRLATETPYGPVLHFIAYTGVRSGEALALKWENLDLERGVASIVATLQRIRGGGLVLLPPKSAAGKRGIALDEATVSVLREHRGRQLLRQVELAGGYEQQGLVFPGPLGQPLDPSAVTRAWEKLTRRAGFTGLRLHDLRHGHAAGLIKAGVHPRVVQDRLGHASAAFTMQVYGHVAAGLQVEAARQFAHLMAQAQATVH
jgi:integrase